MKFYYEDGNQGDAAIDVLGRNYQEFVLSLLLELEDSGMRDEWIAFAAALQFGHTAELVAVLDQDTSDEALTGLRNRIGTE